MKHIVSIICLGLAYGLLATSLQARVLERQTMRDWNIRCTDERYCIAETQGVSEHGDQMVFKLERSIKPEARIYVTTAPKGRNLSLKSHISVSIVGHDFRFYGDVKQVYDGNEAAFVERSTNKSIQMLKSGRFAKVSVKFGDGGPDVSYDVSLQGVTSVLAMMDVVQGRMDREDAAVIVGGEAKTLISHYDLSDGKAPPKPANSADTDQVATASNSTANAAAAPQAEREASPEESGLGETDLVYEQGKLPDGVLMPGYRMLNCDLPSTIETFGAKVTNLEPGVFLYLVPCNHADVNVPYYAALDISGQIDTAEFQVPAGDGTPTSLLINPHWEKDFEGLSAYQFFSSDQDCGRFEKHRFDWQSEKFFLSEYRQKDNCDGGTQTPQEYPLQWSGEGD